MSSNPTEPRGKHPNSPLFHDSELLQEFQQWLRARSYVPPGLALDLMEGFSSPSCRVAPLQAGAGHLAEKFLTRWVQWTRWSREFQDSRASSREVALDSSVPEAPFVDVFETGAKVRVVLDLRSFHPREVRADARPTSLRVHFRDAASDRPRVVDVTLPARVDPATVKLSVQHGIVEVRVRKTH